MSTKTTTKGFSLDHVTRMELQQERYAICGRAFMVASALMADVGSLETTTNNNNDKNDMENRG